MKKYLALVLMLFYMASCKVEQSLIFDETNYIYNENAVIELNIIKAVNDDIVGNSINNTIENHIVNFLNFDDESIKDMSLKDAIEKFDNDYKAFKDDFQESALIWEATFDAEVTYESPLIVCIAVSSYLNTGGAHGTMNITFFNFDVTTGELLTLNDIVDDLENFSNTAKQYFKEETKTKENIESYFYGEDFHLPENIGLSEDGIILFYNVYEIAPYSTGITEITIPFEAVETYLNDKYSLIL